MVLGQDLLSKVLEGLRVQDWRKERVVDLFVCSNEKDRFVLSGCCENNSIFEMDQVRAVLFIHVLVSHDSLLDEDENFVVLEQNSRIRM